MDDLIGGLMFMMVAAAAIFCAVVVALAMLAAAVVLGSLLVGLRGTYEFLLSLGRRMRGRGGDDRTPLAPEPAFELYVLGQLWRDLKSAGQDAWAAMEQTRQLTVDFGDRNDEGWRMPLGIGAILGGMAGMAVGAVISAVLALPVLIASGIVIAGAWALIGLLRVAEAIRRSVRRTSYECPVDHERFPLPVYVCPGCGAEHRQLVPGRWGIIRRECECGTVALPTMVLNGRQRVPQRCPSGHPMSGLIGYTEMLRIALVAGPSAGKTTFLAGTLHELEQLSQAGTLALSVVDDSRSDFDAALDNLEHGRLPPKTQMGASPALVAEVQGGGRSRALSLYDVAGESYGGDEEIRDLRFLEVPNGLVLLVDPLALERFAVDHEDEIAAARDRLRPSPVPPIRVLERTLGSLQEAGARVDKLPLAIVVGKTDALGIGEEISALEAQHADRAVPEWIEQHGGGNFVRAVESSFKTVGWFHASALGRVPDPEDRSAFEPAGTAEPVLWLLRRNGVTPAPTRFAPEQAAARLSGASAADFPPISPRGWAWRAVPAGALAIGLVVAVVLALASIGGGSSSAAASYGSDPAPVQVDDTSTDGTSTDDTSTDDTSTDDTSTDDTSTDDTSTDDTSTGGGESSSSGTGDADHTTFVRRTFRITLPSSWKADERERSYYEDSGELSYIQSTWHPSYDPAAEFKVDYTPGSTVSGPRSAHDLRERYYLGQPGYEEQGWGPMTIAGQTAWRWEFIWANRHKVDYLFNGGCGAGFGVLGTSTLGNWDKYEPIFQRAVATLEPRC